MGKTIELVCITCPIGCHLQVETLGGGASGAIGAEGAEGPEIQVSGNRCPRGVVYAREETLAPRRVVTATCRVRREPAVASAAGLTAPRRVPLRTTAAFPKERVDELLAAIYALELPLPARRGQVAMKDALGSGIDLIVTRTVE